MEELSKQKIMLVDDNMANLAIAKGMLEELYDFYPLPSASRLFKFLEHVKPDLILLDVDMPDMDGYGIIKILKADQKYADIPVIFITARTEEADELKGFALGAVDYVTKPFSAAILARRIENQLLIQKQKAELKNFNENLIEMVKEGTHKVVELQESVLRETVQNERVRGELNIARAIQEGILPKVFPPFSDFTDVTIFASMTPAKEIVGDFYDFFIVGENKIAIVIADVSGKGIPAALFMMVSRALIKSRALYGDDLHELLTAVNNQLCQDNDTGMFVTAFVGVLDTKLNVLRYVNAGHMPPVLLRGGQASWLPVKPGLVLGISEDVNFAVQETAFEKGDLLLLYTDGVTEAMNEKDGLFGNDRLINVLSVKAKEAIESFISPEELVKAVANAIEQFAENAEQADDITMLALHRIRNMR